MIGSEGGYSLRGFTVFDGFYPFGFEDGVGFQVVEGFVLLESAAVAQVELDGNKLDNYLIGSVFYVSAQA